MEEQSLDARRVLQKSPPEEVGGPDLESEKEVGPLFQPKRAALNEEMSRCPSAVDFSP